MATLLSTNSVMMDDIPGNVTYPIGFRAYGVHAGLRRKRLDMALLWSCRPATLSGMFTTNAAKAAPVILTKQVAERGLCQALVVNSANANALTGELGERHAYEMQHLVAQGLHVPPPFVAVASTGVIGVPLPMPLVTRGISDLIGLWSNSRDETQSDGVNASQAILTTDTMAKTGARQVRLSGGSVRLGMMVKGSGMVHPQMATILGFITTDAEIAKPIWDDLIRYAVDRTFHRISVDGDASTNDMVLGWANGMSGVSVTSEADQEVFRTALTDLLRQGARDIARDGEGATHLVTVMVTGATTEADAAAKARAAVRSPLVKSAVYGRDPNWGRVVAAVGSLGEPFDPTRIDLTMNGMPLLQAGKPVCFNEEQARSLMAREEVVFVVDLHSGKASAEAWGCDLTERYVAINAQYRRA